ncbi:MAG: OmpA family protein [Thermaurantimonas sp.]
MKKTFLIVLLIPLLNMAQLHPYIWRVGIQGGFSTYYGDLTPYRLRGDGVGRVLGHLYTFNQEYFPAVSWQVSAERSLNSTLSLKVAIGNVNFSANDRFVKPDGTLWAEAPFFDRGLNAETTIYDGSIGLIFKTDNLRFLSHRAFIAPYFGIHFVALNFETYADLRDNEGNFYNLSNPNLRQEGTYETLLTGLRTEGVDYSTIAFGGRLELGIRFRLSRQLNLNISTQYTITSTDYLDDVSAEYPTQFTSTLQQRASDPTNRRLTISQRGDDFFADSYLFHSVGIQWSFGSRSRLKKFPIIGGFAPPPGSENLSSIFDPAIRRLDAPSPTAEIEDSLLFLIQTQQEDIDDLRDKLNRAIMGLQAVEGRIRVSNLTAEANRIETQIAAADDSIKYLKEMLKELHLDTILPKSIQDSLSANILQRQKQLVKQRDSLNTRLQNIHLESDSLSSWIENSEKSLDQIPLTTSVKTKPSALTFTSSIAQGRTRSTSQSNNEDLSIDEYKDTATIVENQIEKKSTTTQIEPSMPSEVPISETIQSQEPPKSDITAVSSQSTPSTSNQQTFVNTPTSSQDVAPSRSSPQSTRSSQPSIRRSQPSTRSPQSSGSTDVKTSISISPSKTVSSPLSPTDTNQSKDIVRILEQQTLILQLLTEQITALQDRPKHDSTLKQTSDSAIIIEKKPDNLDSLQKQSDTAKTRDAISFGIIAGFKTLAAVYFQSGKTSLDSAEELHLKDIAKYLADSTSSYILLRGFADNTGSPSVNFQIIAKRLEYVRNLLTQEGVSPSRIREENAGIIVKKTAGSQPLDRRVEIILILPTD